MSTESFAGGTAFIASCGSKNPLVAAMAQAILSQGFSLSVSQANEAGAQQVGSAARESGHSR